jgi:protein SCO1/2
VTGARAAAVAAMLALLAGCSSRGSHGGWPMGASAIAPDLPLRGAGGTTLSLARSGGRLSLVTFGYCSCPDVCPTTLADWHRVRRRLGPDAERVRFVFVSVDYRSDTPEMAAAFARRFDPAFEGVALDSLEIRRVLPPFKAQAAYETSPGGQLIGVSHTDYTYLVDDRGRIRLGYEFSSDPGLVARDLRSLLAARRARRG